jgi:hypothetical protein
MLRNVLFCAAALLSAFGNAYSQSPYAGDETREIKALSPQEVSDLLAGKGMGFAKTAELNGFPGPAHVLELASQLQLRQSKWPEPKRCSRRCRRKPWTLAGRWSKKSGCLTVSSLQGLSRRRSSNHR